MKSNKFGDSCYISIDNSNREPRNAINIKINGTNLNWDEIKVSAFDGRVYKSIGHSYPVNKCFISSQKALLECGIIKKWVEYEIY